MKNKDSILQEMKALSLGPSWTEKSFDTSAQESVAPKFEKKKLINIKRKDPSLINVDISLKPTTELMDLLVQTMKKTCITYRFFPIVNFFLHKKEYKIVLTSLKNNAIFCTLVENLPFSKKEKAENYLVDKYWDDFFYAEAISLNKPKGNFNSINRCGITGVLLGPPNYHLYSDLLREHYEQHLKEQCSWEIFLNNIKNDSDPKIIQQWFELMSRGYRYHLKQNPDVVFENHTLAKQYLLKHIDSLKDEVREVKHVVLPNEKINQIVDIDLKQAILDEIENEYHVPVKIGYLCSARFRHSGFHVYKKGHDMDKITYVCAIKRRIRDEYTSFSQRLESIIECIEKHPCESLENLTKYYFGISQKVENWLETINQECYFEFKKNLLFLIQQGWITQYEDGTLYVSPKQTFASKNNQKYA